MAKTRKKKKTGTADAIHIDINSHNAKGQARYEMMGETRNLISDNVEKGTVFNYLGVEYIFDDLGSWLVIRHRQTQSFEGTVEKINKTSIKIKRFFWIKNISATVPLKYLYYVGKE